METIRIEDIRYLREQRYREKELKRELELKVMMDLFEDATKGKQIILKMAEQRYRQTKEVKWLKNPSRNHMEKIWI